jgi:hypothetical protein
VRTRFCNLAGVTRPPVVKAASSRFHVAGLVVGSGFGVLTVAPNVLTFDPGRLTRFVLRLSGRLVHRRRTVVVISNPLWVGGVVLALQADTAQDTVVSSPLLGRSFNVTHANLWIAPWQRSRVLSALRGAGLDVERRRRWLFSVWQRVD